MPEAEEQIDGFIAKFDPKMQKLIRSCRAAMRRRLPHAHELVYDNYNFFVIAYCSTERASDAILSLASNSHGVTLFFLWGAKLPDPAKVLEGAAKQVRYLRLESAAALKRPEVDALIDAAAAYGKNPLAASGKAKTVVKAIAKKQRPRR